MSKILDLFKEKKGVLLNEYSSRDSNSGIGAKEPFIEVTPNDPNRKDIGRDSRALPIISSKNQVERITKLFTTERGIAFLAKQPLLRAQVARPDLKTKKKLGAEPFRVAAEIIASQVPPVRGERFASKTFGDEKEEYHKAELTTPLGSKLPVDNIERKRKMLGYSDGLNQTEVVKSSDTTKIKEYDALDFIPFKFKDIVNKKIIYFRATVTGISETFAPEWNAYDYTGRPFKLYTYSGVERSLSFSFKLYPLNARELMANWERYNYLVGLTYPANYLKHKGDNKESLHLFSGEAGFMQPPFVEITIGNMYKDRPGIITNLSMTVDDSSPWEIGGTRITKRADAEFRASGNEATKDVKSGMFDRLKSAATSKVSDTLNSWTGKYEEQNEVVGIDDYKLPHILEIGIQMTLFERELRKTGDKLYDFGKVRK